MTNAIDQGRSGSLQPGMIGTSEKRQRDNDELKAQSLIFAAGWRHGDRVMTWLHRHEGQLGELSSLMNAGWLLDDIGLAMHAAGIAYRTGTPIPGGLLRRKLSLARAKAQAKNTQQPVETKSQIGIRSAISVPKQRSMGLDDEPEFKPASLIRHPGKKSAEAIVSPPQTLKAPPAPPIDVDEVLARFTGRK